MPGRPVSPTDLRQIKQWRAEGATYRQLAAVTGRSYRAIQHIFDYHLKGMRKAHPVHVEPVSKVRVPPAVEHDRARRAELEPRSLSAGLLGDPMPGQSALDKRK